ncbi:hypothetical protein GCM10008015_26550 [Flavobacterium palustre]|uniref:AAA+ ATPase domain-containing protein n=1 Tax=Flavobacterium palustre TaxID=1476463 RepID=A0ABQ1HNK9_9FLAO|nr:ATP-binding protein [Flavobacterium palustre]GGA84449.1 hypothetical protein GCM10008015_26550 [Flavobacterium palustre]
MSKKINRAYSVQNVLSKKFNPLEFSGEWESTLGQPDKAFSAIIWGGSGEGKTEAAIKLAKYLTNFGKVAYNSLEQGLSATIQNALVRNHMDTVDNSFVLLDREPFDDLFKRMSKPKSPDFLFIDSVQYTRINKNQYYQLKELMLKKGKGLIWISQAKGKEPKGALADDIRYDVDLKLRVEGFKLFPDGRLNGGGEPFVIWAQKAAKYWKEIA